MMLLEDRYNKGFTFEQYRDGMRLNQQEMQQIYEKIKFREENLQVIGWAKLERNRIDGGLVRRCCPMRPHHSTHC